MSTLLEMRNICKFFTGVKANEDVNLVVEKGEVHALLGENGAGKSTLMNVLYGLYAPTSGEILLKGQPVEIASPKRAIEMGIGMVHQHFMLIPALSVVENVILGMKSPKSPMLDYEDASKKIRELAAEYHMDIDPEAKVWQLSVGQQQRLEILKALYRGADLLILDEPTAVLTPQEVEELFNMIRKLTANGHTVIFISHKLNEVLEICNNVTVLRLGKSVATLSTKGTNKDDLAKLMVGRDVSLKMDKAPAHVGETVLEVEGLYCKNDKGVNALNGLGFEVKAGEILGICGVDGNGQSELVDVIAGLRPCAEGKVLIKGKDMTGKSPREILNENVSHIPEDRHKRGVVLSMNLVENILLMNYDRPGFSKASFLKWKEIVEYSNKILVDYQVKTTSQVELMQNLSGGNQQKVVLGRELSREPDLLIAMHPARGLDIGATEYIHKRLLAERERGAAILLISTELEEIISLSDRVAVIYEGQIMDTVPPDTEIHKLGLLMAGTKDDGGQAG